MTKVIFRHFGGKAIALFPELPGDYYSPATCLSYQHVGQHGIAAAEPLGRPATPEEYGPLLRELESIGYDDLRIVKRFTVRDWHRRRAGTIAQKGDPS